MPAKDLTDRDINSFFSQNCQQARQRFISAAQASNAELETIEFRDGEGPHGESLLIPVAGKKRINLHVNHRAEASA